MKGKEFKLIVAKGTDKDILKALNKSFPFVVLGIHPITKQGKIKEEIGRYLANDFEDYAKIIKALESTLKTDPNRLIDHVHFKKLNTIDPIQTLEYTYTVKDFCDLVGIKTK